MKLPAFLGLAGAVAIVFGLEFLLIPELALSQYGVPTESHNLMQARYFGSTLLAFGLVTWLARKSAEDGTRRALLIGGCVGNLAGLVLSLWSRNAGLQNMLAWLSVCIYATLLLGCLNYLLRPSRRD
jgi:FtsH-binding integral membrane protein